MAGSRAAVLGGFVVEGSLSGTLILGVLHVGVRVQRGVERVGCQRLHHDGCVGVRIHAS